MSITQVSLSNLVGALISLVGASTLKQIVNHFGKLIAITINEFIFKFARQEDDLYAECSQCKKRYYYSAYRGHFRDMKVCSKCAAPMDISSEILSKEIRDCYNVKFSSRDS